jgi:hypothetical protein
MLYTGGNGRNHFIGVRNAKLYKTHFCGIVILSAIFCGLSGIVLTIIV